MQGSGVEPGALSPELCVALIDALGVAGLGISVARGRRCVGPPLVVNGALARMADCTPEAIVAAGRLPISSVDQERLISAWSQCSGAVACEPFRTEFVGPDSTRVPVELTCAHLQYQGEPATATIIRDISEQVLIENALVSSEASFRRLADTAPDTICVAVRGRFVYANQAAAASLGYERGDDLLGLSIGDILVAEDLRLFQQRLPRIIAGEQLPPMEYRARRRDGSVSMLEISSMATQYEGQPAVVAMGRDTSGRRHAQAALMQADRLATTGVLAAGVAHEINNPLTYVLLHLTRVKQLLQDAELEGSTARHIFELLGEGILGAERIRDVVRDLLSFARPQKARPQPVDVRRVLESALKLAGHVLRDCAAVELDLQDVPTTRGDEAQLGQALLNVLVNAANSFQGGGPAHNRVDVRLRYDAGTAEIVVQVEDNGRGIEAARLRHLFEPLSVPQAGVGAGLGLAITRSVLDDLGGDISVASTVGKGTAVTLRLPATSATDSDRVRLAVVAAEPQRARVLLVDDDRTVAQALAALLQLDHKVDVCFDGTTARQKLSGGQLYDVVVCDLVMAGVTGVALYEQVTRQQPEYAERFVFLTGGVSAPAMVDFVEAHEEVVLHKPVTPDQLMDAVAGRIPSAVPRRP